MATYSEETKMLIQILSSSPLAYHPLLAKIFGGVKCGVMLSQLLYWHGKQANKEGWILKTVAEFAEETALTEREQETARASLIETGAISYKRMGVPAMPHYRVNHAAMIDYALKNKDDQLGQNALSSQYGSNGDLLAQNVLTNNTENTQKTTPGAVTPGKADYLQDLFNRKKAQAVLTTLNKTIDQRVKNEHHKDACLAFAKEFPDCIFDFGEWIGQKGANIEKFIIHFRGDKDVLKQAAELNRKAAKENPMFAARSPVMLVPYLDAARTQAVSIKQAELITVGDGLKIQSL